MTRPISLCAHFCALVICCCAHSAHALNFWLTASDVIANGSDPPATAAAIPSTTAIAGGIGSLYLWGRPDLSPDPGKTLDMWSLNVVSSDSTKLKFTAAAVMPYNQLLTGGPNHRRWEFAGEPADANGLAKLSDISGVTVLNSLTTGVGIGPLGAGGATYVDPFYHAASKSWLLARLDYKAIAIGTAQVNLQIGVGGMVQRNESVAAANVTLGALTDAPLNSRDQKNTNSETSEISVTIVPPDPNFNDDTAIDGLDFLAWQRGFGILTNATNGQGDANGDKKVDAADLAVWTQQFGNQAGTTAVPEPSTAVGAVLAACALLVERRRRWQISRRRRFDRPLPPRVSWMLPPLAALLIVGRVGTPAAAIVIVNDDFDNYATQNAFTSVWTPIGTDGTFPSALISTTQAESSPRAVRVPGTLTNNQYRNRLTFTETNTYSTGSGNLGVSDKLIWSFDFFDAQTPPATPARNYSNLQDGTTMLGTNMLVAMGLNNNRNAGDDGGNYYFARILGYTPTHPGALSGDFFKLNDSGAPLRASGWNNLKVEISTSDGNSTDFRFYVNDILAKTLPGLGTAAQVRSYDTILLGSGLANANNEAYFDNMRLEYVQAPTTTPWINAAGGSFQTASNWQNGVRPGGNSTAVFDLPNTYTVTFAQNATHRGLSVLQGNVTFDLPGRIYNVGQPITVGAATMTVRAGQMVQSIVPNTAGFVVNGGGQLIVNQAGTINSGGGVASIGPVSGANATATVTGLNSTWTNIGQLNVGSGALGASSLTVSNQAVVSTRELNVRTGGTATVGTSATASDNGYINLGNAGPTTFGRIYVGANGVLGGGGTIIGNVLNDAGGRVRPGNSPGTMTINGNYTQNDKGTLEIEVAGPNEADHDLVVVTPPGIATLNGTLDVQALNGYTPAVGQQFTFLTAATINGSFSSVKADLPAGMAPRVVDAPVGPLQARQIQFVSTVTEIELKPQETPGPLNWNNADTTWKNIANNDPARVPDTADIISVSNNSGADREVQVQSTNAFVNQLALQDSEDEFKVTVTGGLSLSAVDSATIGGNAVISLDNGNFVSDQVDVTAGGTITGNGAIKTDDLIVGATLGEEPAKFKPGLNGVGTTSIEGNLTLGVGSETTIDVASSTQFDKIDLQGTADFGGTLVVNVTNDATVQPGSIIEIVTATNLAEGDAFDLVRTVGSTDTVFVPRFTPGAVSATVSLQGLPRGDLSLDGVFNPAADAAALAMAFTNPTGYKASHQGTSGAIMGNVNNDDFFDFDDITAFRQLAGMTVAELAEIFRTVAGVPEPNSFALVSLALLAWRPTSRCC